MSRSHRIMNYIRAKLPKKIKKKNKIKQNRTKNSAVFVTSRERGTRSRVRSKSNYIHIFVPAGELRYSRIDLGWFEYNRRWNYVVSFRGNEMKEIRRDWVSKKWNIWCARFASSWMPSIANDQRETSRSIRIPRIEIDMCACPEKKIPEGIVRVSVEKKERERERERERVSEWEWDWEWMNEWEREKGNV